MITIPATELIGGLSDVIPIITDPKGALAGVEIRWDGEALHFTAYDVFSAGTVAWFPGDGAEKDEDENAEEIEWGGEDAPWAAWIYLDDAKEILKLFKLPAKLWRTPVTIKCSLSGDRLIVERTDSPRGERLLTLPADPAQLAHIPPVRVIADRVAAGFGSPVDQAEFFHQRLGSFGAVRAHGTLRMVFGQEGDPTAVFIGTRYAGFIYPASAKNVRPFNLLRDGAGVMA